MANLDSYRTLLASSVVFKGLRTEDLDAVLAVAELVTRKPKELILSEGSLTDGLYVILEGDVEVFLPERAGSGAHRASRVRLNRLGPGRCLGEYGVTDDQPTSASAEALTPATLCFVPKAEFRRLVDRHDRLGRVIYGNLLRYLVSRLRGKDRELDIFLLEK